MYVYVHREADLNCTSVAGLNASTYTTKSYVSVYLNVSRKFGVEAD